jgi:hypothetical protein
MENPLVSELAGRLSLVNDCLRSILATTMTNQLSAVDQHLNDGKFKAAKRVIQQLEIMHNAACTSQYNPQIRERVERMKLAKENLWADIETEPDKVGMGLAEFKEIDPFFYRTLLNRFLVNVKANIQQMKEAMGGDKLSCRMIEDLHGRFVQLKKYETALKGHSDKVRSETLLLSLSLSDVHLFLKMIKDFQQELDKFLMMQVKEAQKKIEKAKNTNKLHEVEEELDFIKEANELLLEFASEERKGALDKQLKDTKALREEVDTYWQDMCQQGEALCNLDLSDEFAVIDHLKLTKFLKRLQATDPPGGVPMKSHGTRCLRLHTRSSNRSICRLHH